MNYIYLIKNTEESYYKIGVSKDPKKRIKELNTGNSAELVLVEMYESELAYKIERTLHRKYSYMRKHGEWFDLSIKEDNEFIKDCRNIERGIKVLIEAGNEFI